MIDSVGAMLRKANRAESLHLAGFSRGGWWASYFATNVCETRFNSVTLIGGYPSETPQTEDMEQSAKHLVGTARTAVVISSLNDECCPAFAYSVWFATLEAEGGHVRMLEGVTHADLLTQFVNTRAPREPEIVDWLHTVWRSI